MHNDLAASPIKTERTAVLLCKDLASQGSGLNLEELVSSLEATFPGIAVEVVSDLCEHPGHLYQLKTRLSFNRAVLGLCSGDYPQVKLHTQARKAGLDPFGLEVVPLGTLCNMVHSEPQATWKAKALLTAAVVRANAFEGSEPENAKLYFLPRNQKVTRRSLITMPPFGYRPVPSIRKERCVTKTGCRLCVKVCPQDALQKIGGHILLDKSGCEGCGVCLAACPKEAIDFPGWSLAQYEAQIAALLDSATARTEPFGLLLTCQKAFGKLEGLASQGVSYSHQWLPVAIPCLGMVTPTWILQSLASGAETVALLSCCDDCSFKQGQAIAGRVNFCRKLLRLLGQSSDRVCILNASQSEKLCQTLQKPPPQRENGHPNKLGDSLRLGSLEGAFRSIQRLVDADTVPHGVALTLEHPYSPFGVVELRADGCTGCLTCAKVCPTGALVSENSRDRVTMSFVASLCNGCGMCVDVCPEAATKTLQVRRMTNMDTLSHDRVELYNDQLAICKGCGASIASQALLRRIKASLAPDNKALHTVLSSYCPSCRSSLAFGDGSFSSQLGVAR